MPPSAAMRKGTTSMTMHQTQAADDNGAHVRRTTSGRAVRQNTNRPTNYYARPFGNTANTANDNDRDEPPGFFPAVTFFTDAITALPKDVMRQLTLVKEVEAKIWANGEKFEEVVNEVMEYPVPSKPVRELRDANGVEDVVASVGPLGGQGSATLMSLTANNSVVGSNAPSLVNGITPGQLSAQHSVAGSWNGEEGAGQAGNDEDLSRRQRYHEMRTLIASMLPNMDEKGLLLSEANRILARQHVRIDSVMPFVEQEISEEARLGSMTHWAYSDNRQRKQVPGTAAQRKDVAATNSLAAAANVMRELDIAAARTVGTRDGREKQKGKSREQLDSDFDDRPKKTHAKIAKSKVIGPAGLGIAAIGEPVKKRKVDKGLPTPAMERSVSMKGSKAVLKEASRSTPGAEPIKKARTKPAPLPMKRKGMTSAHDSPALASSPLHSTFTAATMEPPGVRSNGGKVRQSSNATNLRHEKLAGDEGSRPSSAPGKSHERKRKAPPADESERDAKKTTESSDGQARSNRALPDLDHVQPSRSNSNSGKAGQGSAVGTPRTDSFPEGAGAVAMQRAASRRSARVHREESESEPGGGEARPNKLSMHKRQASNSHLVKQLASFNRSPDADRHLDEDSDENDDSDEALERRRQRREKAEAEERANESRSPKKRRPMSRRNTLNQVGGVAASSPPPNATDGETRHEDTAMAGLPAADASPRSQVDNVLDQQALVATPEIELPQPSSPPTNTAPSSPRSSPTPEPLSPPTNSRPLSPSPALSNEPPDLEPHANDEMADDDDDLAASSEGDPDDPNEPKYCYCDRGSYGEMIACDNEQCPREWFHLGCTGLREPPDEEEKWYCRECAPIFLGQGRGTRGRGGRGRGRG